MPFEMRSRGAPQDQDGANWRVYHARGIERRYAREDRLTRAEAMALLRFHAAVAGREVLDIGVGAGRTTAYLAPLAASYLGIDYAQAMVDHVRRTQPRAPVRLGDMRDLSALGDASVDFVFGSNCVVDAVSHDDRLRTLREFRRVLRPDGLLIFSAHNRAWTEALAAPRLGWSRNPGTLLANVARWARQVANRRRMLPLQRVEADYALLTDVGHDFNCLHYYVHPDVQRRQLEALGFGVVDALDRDGVSLPAGDASPRSPWIMYAARPAALGRHGVSTEPQLGR